MSKTKSEMIGSAVMKISAAQNEIDEMMIFVQKLKIDLITLGFIFLLRSARKEVNILL